MHGQRFAGAHARAMHGHMRTQKCASRDVFIDIQTLGQIKRNTDTYAHARTHTCTHVHACALIHTHTHTHTHTQHVYLINLLLPPTEAVYAINHLFN